MTSSGGRGPEKPAGNEDFGKPPPIPRYAENDVVVDPCGPYTEGNTNTDDDDGAQRTRR